MKFSPYILQGMPQALEDESSDELLGVVGEVGSALFVGIGEADELLAAAGSTIFSIATTRSFSRGRIIRTPWVFLPSMETSATFSRITWPLSVMIIKSSLSATGLICTISPLRSVCLMVIMPLPPLDCERYCEAMVRFP